MTFFPVSVDELKYDKNRIFTRLKLRADPNTNAYAESIFPYLVELLRENIELVLAYNITDNDLTIARRSFRAAICSRCATAALRRRS